MYNMYNTSGNIMYNKPIIYNTTTNVGYVPISKLDSDYNTRIYGPNNDDESYILASSDENRRKAVEAIYKRGYITRDEANDLVIARHAKRNECTTIYCVDNGAEIVIFCTESTSFLQSETLFKFSYEKFSGNVTEEKDDLL